MDGILNVYKERGFTSHDVVAKLRGILKMRKIGHTGTLDPDACGVLPVCLGQATKVCELLTEKRKTYEAVLLLGRETDTQDISGEILCEKAVNVTEEEIRRTIRSFEGDQLQVPPMYSALKVGGRKLYELAREGKTVERKARPVTFYEITVLSIDIPRVRIRVTCSKGTYIRTLCHDIGQILDCGGCMEELLRTRVEPFDLADSLTLEQIRRLTEEGQVEKVICPVDRLFVKLPARQIRPEYVKYMYNGNPLLPSWLREYFPAGEEHSGEESSDREGLRIRLYTERGIFFGVYEYQEEQEHYKVKKLFYTA